MSKEVTYHDPNQISPKNILTEDNIGFIETVNRFMGRQANVKIPAKLYKDLDEYLIKYRHPIGEYFRNLPVEKNVFPERIGNLNGTSVNMLISLLKETGNSSYYDDINPYRKELFWMDFTRFDKMVG